MIGIYKITNKINGKCYIGQSIDIEKRWKDHQLPCRQTGKSSNYPLYRAFKKYGLNNFNFSVIEECELDQLDIREQYWIKYYDSYNNGYNATLGGQGIQIASEPVYQYDLFGRYIAEFPSIGVAASLVPNMTYNKIHDALVHRHNQERTDKYQWSFDKKDNIGHPSIYTPVVCFDLNGKRLNEYFCLNAAAEACGTTITNILQACQDHQIHSYKYQWRFWDEVQDTLQIEAVQPYTDKKKVKQYTLDGKLIKEYNSITEAALESQCNRSNIVGVCTGRNKSAGRYLWKYSDDNSTIIYKREYKSHMGPRKVNQYDLNDNYIATYDSIKLAGTAVGHPTCTTHISSCCTGKRKTAFGYKWRYADEEES